MNPMDEKGFGRNCDNSEQHGIRCIGEGSIVMKPDALVRTCFRSVCSPSVRYHSSTATMANNNNSSGSSNRLHRPDGAGFVCVKEDEWWELREQVEMASEMMKKVKEALKGEEEVMVEVREWLRKERDENGNEGDVSSDYVRAGPEDSDADRMSLQLSENRRRLAAVVLQLLDDQ